MNIILLTGGKSVRFGSDKVTAKINGKSLLEITISNLKGHDLILVGPESAIHPSYAGKFVREFPPFSGPLAAIGEGLKLVTSDEVGIFAADMPFAPLVIDQLLSNLKDEAALALDDKEFRQPLAGIYRTTALRRVLDELGDLSGKSVKSAVEKLIINEVAIANPELLMDIDTEEDLKRAIDLNSRLSQ